MNPKTLGELIALMKDGPVVKLPRREEWSDMIARLNVPGRVCEVEEETYDYFLEVLPPRWMGRGAGFAFGEGSDPLRVFWKAGGNYFCRQLSEEESEAFCRLAGISVTSG